MPLLDVSDVLADPDFADTFTLLRSVQTVDEHGRASEATSSQPQSGAVTAKGGSALNRTPEGQIVYGSISIHTQFRLIEGDRLRWNGAEYTVAGIEDYTRYGAGFVCASCDLLPLTLARET